MEMQTAVRRVLYAILALDAIGVAVMLVRSECSLPQIVEEASRERGREAYQRQAGFDRTQDGLDLWHTPQGPMWMVHGDKILPFLVGEQYTDIYEPGGHQVRPGDIVLDCGANVGVFTRKALSRGAKLIVAIEPSPITLKALRRNLEAEIRDGRVIVYAKGVWDQDGELELTQDPSNEGTNTLVLAPGSTRPKVRVPLTTIDHIIAELKLPRVDFIKMDIEGAEKQALKGGADTIKHFRPRMSLSSEHLKDDFTAIPALVRSIEPRYAYKGCDCDPGWTFKALVLAFDPAP